MPLLLLTYLLLGQQPAATAQIPPIAQKTAGRTTGTACCLYTRPSTQSPMLSIVPVGAQVQVTDSANNAYFVHAQFSKNGKVLSGYMYRACLNTAP
ncbi:SH3 domain-containing protein [Hymenobacter sp. 15J16-1T3B]|uniref:SH3 domain-containing protein n=1 Tax=Hymenobacter sp. 15J16-1T3B TaxID=2886941 RepID=UPI001D12EDDF|nr:SH3 domain-containing protein [Hymenobacter sp. 15J16-1T3B]MCC3156523.1 SH3 domain-containing protein [Hymenobacter sp. 15J16-1T3B]